MKAASRYTANGPLSSLASTFVRIGVILGFAALDAAAQFAPMSVSGGGVGPIDFSTPPSITNGWGTRIVPTGDGDITVVAAMDTAVNTYAASIITNQIPTDTGPLNFGVS